MSCLPRSISALDSGALAAVASITLGRDRGVEGVGVDGGDGTFALPVRFKASSMIWFAKSGVVVAFAEGSPLAILRWEEKHYLDIITTLKLKIYFEN